MKKTYFLDKIHNANFKQFDVLIKAVIKDLYQENYPYTFFKKGDKWIIDIERDKDLISIVFDDYTMCIYNNVKKLSANNSHYWQDILFKFLTKKQQLQYKKNLEKQNDLMEEASNTDDNLNKYIIM